MIRAALLLAAGLAACPARAQLVSPLTSGDTSSLATKAEVAALQAQMPLPATSLPPTEQVAPALGTSTRYRRMDDVQPRITRAGSCVLSASGTCTITWATPMPVAPNVVLSPINSGAMPVDCNTTAAPTTTSVSIKCWTAQSVTVAILGAVVAPFVTAAAGITVQATAIPPTQ